MQSRRIAVTTLALTLLLAMLPGSPAIAETPGSSRELEDAIRLGLTSDAWLIDSEQITGSISDAVAESQRRAIAESKLNAAKAAQRELGRLYRTARREASGPDSACERAVIDRMYQQEHARYQALIVAYRAELGYVDRQKVITKLSRFVKSVAEQTVKEAGPELIVAFVSGGLGGGVGKAILRRTASRVVQRRGESFLARAVLGQPRVHMAAAATQALAECQPKDAPSTTAVADASGPPAIPAGTYVGSFDDIAVTAFVLTERDSVVKTNTLEVEVAEDGAVSGGFEVGATGVFTSGDESVACPGGSSNVVGMIDSGQRIGPALPQTLTIAIEYTIISHLWYEFGETDRPIYCNGPVEYPDGFPSVMTFLGFAGGTINGDIESVPFVLASD